MSLRRLRIEQIGLYQLHNVNTRVPIEESIGALAAIQAEGKVRHIGVCNVNLEQLARAFGRLDRLRAKWLQPRRSHVGGCGRRLRARSAGISALDAPLWRDTRREIEPPRPRLERRPYRWRF